MLLVFQVYNIIIKQEGFVHLLSSYFRVFFCDFLDFSGEKLWMISDQFHEIGEEKQTNMQFDLVSDTYFWVCKAKFAILR